MVGKNVAQLPMPATNDRIIMLIITKTIRFVDVQFLLFELCSDLDICNIDHIVNSSLHYNLISRKQHINIK